MNNSIIGTWNPATLVLPEVPADATDAVYFILSNGRIRGINVDFKKGEWLVYHKENGVSSWNKTTGIVKLVSHDAPSPKQAAHNSRSSISNDNIVTIPGEYTKVTIDNHGNIIDANNLTEEDIPPHNHLFNEIKDKENIEEFIKHTLRDTFITEDDPNDATAHDSIKFSYTDDGKIVANAIIDDLSITKNEFGQLMATSGGSCECEVDLGQLQSLSDRIDEVELEVERNKVVVNNKSGLTSNGDANVNELAVKVDGTSIRVNLNGELEVNPDFIVDDNGSISSPEGCGGYEPEASQVKGLKEAVENIVQDMGGGLVDVTDLPIDGTTIIINENGELSAVNSALKDHTHTMSEIEDLDPRKADVWATEQKVLEGRNSKLDLHGLGSSISIGNAIATLSKRLEEQEDDLSNVSEQIGKIEVPPSRYIDYSTFEVTYTKPTIVWDTQRQERVTAGENILLTSGPIYPKNKGTLYVIIDGKEFDSIELSNDTKAGDFSRSGHIKIESTTSFYSDTAFFLGGEEDSVKISFVGDDIPAGNHRIELKQIVDVITDEDKGISESKTFFTKTPVVFNKYNILEPSLDIQEEAPSRDNSDFASGIPVYNNGNILTYKVKLQNVDSDIFRPLKVLTYKINDIETSIKAENFNPNIPIEIKITMETGLDYLVIFDAFNIKGDKVSKDFFNGKRIFNSTLYPEILYRTSIPVDHYNNIPEMDIPYSPFNPSNPISNGSLVVRNGIASIDTTNYKIEYNDSYPNYSTLVPIAGKFWLDLRFPSAFRNNIFLDLVDENEEPFEISRDGTLNGISLFFGQGAGDPNNGNKRIATPIIWANGNKPFDGVSKANSGDNNFAGLDLFRSSSIRRYITFGVQPKIGDVSGYIYLKLGISGTLGKSINYDILVKSILESINE